MDRESLDWFESHVDFSEEVAADAFLEELMQAPMEARSVHLPPAIEETSASPRRLSQLHVPADFRFGVWIDVGNRALAMHADAHATRLREIGVTDACIMVNRLDDDTFRYGAVTPRTLQAFAERLRQVGVHVTLTTWLRPTRSYIDGLVASLPRLARSIGARAIEFDVEGPWVRGTPTGFSDHNAAATHLLDSLSNARADGLELAMTCQVDPVTQSKFRVLARGVDLLVPQAYSSYRRGVPSHAIDGAYGPRGIQDRAVRRIRRAVPTAEAPTIMGLAAYGRQSWPGTSSEALMHMELEHTLGLRSAGVRGVRYWSWKHIVGLDGAGGRPANSYALGFFRGLDIRRQRSGTAQNAVRMRRPNTATSPPALAAPSPSATPEPSARPPWLRSHRPSPPTYGQDHNPQGMHFNCAAENFAVIPATYLPARSDNADAALTSALSSAGLDSQQQSLLNRRALLPFAEVFGTQALTELLNRLRWSPRSLVSYERRRHMLAPRLLLHIPGHFRELARRTRSPQEAHALECVGWLLMVRLRDAVAQATSVHWWTPPPPEFVTSLPNPLPALSAELTQLIQRSPNLSDPETTVEDYTAHLRRWENSLAGRQWREEVEGTRPGLPFYPELLDIPEHVDTSSVRSAFATAWNARLAGTDRRHRPLNANASQITLSGLQNAVALRRCDNSNTNLPTGALSSLSLQGLELAYHFPMTTQQTRQRQLTLMRQLHPVYEVLFRTLKELGWNDLVYQSSGAACFRGIKHPAAERVNIEGRSTLVDPFSSPDATTVSRINTHFSVEQRARVVAKCQVARRLSEHGLGAAIDLNVQENTQAVAGRGFGSMDPRVVALFEAFHFRWGACFRTTDPQHFEYCRSPCAPPSTQHE